MLNNIISGIKPYFGAFSLISKLKLWKYFAIPILISVFTAIVIGVSAYGLSDNIVDFVTSLFPSWHLEPDSWMFKILEFISGLFIIAIGLIIYKHIIMALSAPFMSPVSEKIEAHLIGHEKSQHRNTSFKAQLWRGIRINVRNLSIELLLTIPILIISFIPVIGIFSSVLLFLVQAYYAGFGNFDYTLERHFKYSESITFVRQHRGFAIGNGIVFILFLLVPVIGIIFVLPLSVTAASITTVNLLQKQHNLNRHDL
ncbi:EI24 domain-containing protein [Geojedonia litorea]|uniref:EI24 domain-containing protein n=1 Tax=Geojedonia litorea TaxID=1268269 RepID=A0ABV9N8P0_9FLAO